MRDGTETRERIERTALKLFVAKGVAETSMRDIAKASATSLGAIYNHFPSKEELAWQLFAAIFSEAGNELFRRAHAERTPERKLRAMIAYVFELAERDQAKVTFLFNLRNQYVDRLPVGIGNPYLAFREVIIHGIEAGRFRKLNANVATTMVIGVVNQLVDSKVMGLLRANMPALTDVASEACLKILRA